MTVPMYVGIPRVKGLARQTMYVCMYVSMYVCGDTSSTWLSRMRICSITLFTIISVKIVIVQLTIASYQSIKLYGASDRECAVLMHNGVVLYLVHMQCKKIREGTD